jgi:hypothetical protein
MPTQTAYKSYDYDSEIGYEKKFILKDVIQECHAYNSKQNRWKLFPLKEGAFGFDNLAVCIMYILNKGKTIEKLEKKDIDKLSDYVHRAWIKNYTYWRDNEPWKSGDYIKAAKPLNDENRNKLAETNYDDLPEDEKEKDRIIARFIKQKFI